MLTILLADDDILTLNQLNMYLTPLKDITVIGQVTDGADVFPYLSSENPPQILIEQNRCAMACQGCGIAIFFFL